MYDEEKRVIKGGLESIMETRAKGKKRTGNQGKAEKVFIHIYIEIPS